MKRFQEVNKLIQIWRYRWYLLIPFKLVKIVFIDKSYPWSSRDFLWKILVGDAQYKMKWYYTMEEVMERLEKHKAQNL